ncbi:MAG: valine--tRNA ligase [Solirubrobacterales bacterium]|nr:valine--tRNA ligase [Solirubrobacterales bacterium]
MPERDRETLEATTRYDPAEVEGRILERWLESGVFRPEIDPSRADEAFAISIPPPNVTGALHMGHALNGTIQDALTRLNRMRGRPTLWALGLDHAGIATQAVVEKELRAQGVSRHELGREAFVERVWEWRHEYGSRIVEQYKRLGASCDYDDERFTLDERYVAAVMKVFVSLYERGYIYRDNYMVNWDPGTRSAISDLEVEMRDVADALYEIDYPVLDGDGEALTVATVRPETMLGDTAVAVNPDDERYAHLVGRSARLPLVGRELPIIADAHVDAAFGTGALKITPGHDPNDFEVGRAHGLEEIVVIGEDGRMSEAAGERFAGLPAAEARGAVVEALREQGALRSEKPYTHSVPFSERSGARIEPLISLQWFCRMDELAKPAIEAVEREELRIVPASYKRVYLDWMRKIRPWCVSRQLWWGHRLPVWYCQGCGEVSVAEAPPDPLRCGECGGELEQETDVLDTWFSSALWPFAVLGWPEDTEKLRTYYPTSFLTTAREIIFLWVARMTMMGIEFAGEIPFREVYVHPVVQAPDGRRMSKSLGTGIDPLSEIDVSGADALRFGLLAMSSTQDVRYSADRVGQGRDLANKMWNASRLVLLNADPEAMAAGTARSEAAEDRWILSRTERAVGRVGELLDAYDFAHAALELYDFFWSELCDWYLEIVKPRLYDGDPEATRTLVGVLERTLAMAHPMMPFVSEEIYSYLRAFLGDEAPELLAAHAYPHPTAAIVDPGAEAELEHAIGLVRSVRRWRDLVAVPAGTRLRARFEPGAQPPELVLRLGRLEPADQGETVARIGPLAILASEGLDAAGVERRLDERREMLRSEVNRAERKLSNQGFVAKAPADVVEEERRKLDGYRAELEELAGV